MGLTKARVQRARYDPDGPAQQVVWDGDIPGFGLRVYPSGTKSYVLRYRPEGGGTRYLTLGKASVLSLDDARHRARKRLVEVGDGQDPALEKKRRRREARDGLTVKEYADRYVEEYAKQEKKTWKEDQRRIEKHVMPAFGSRKLEEVTEDDVRRLHRSIGEDSPYEANRVLALVSVMWNEARTTFKVLPADASNPAEGIKKFNEKSRDRYLRSDEVARLAKAIGQEESPFDRAAFWLYLFTGARKMEVLSLTWDAVNLEHGELHLEDTKAGRDHTLPLPEPAVDILRELPRFEENPHVFPGRSKGSHLSASGLRNPWERIRERANLKDVTLHDLRRTVGSWLAQSGESLHLIGAILNHSQTETTKRYARLAKQQEREALEKHAARVLEAVNGQEGGGDE